LFLSSLSYNLVITYRVKISNSKTQHYEQQQSRTRASLGKTRDPHQAKQKPSCSEYIAIDTRATLREKKTFFPNEQNILIQCRAHDSARAPSTPSPAKLRRRHHRKRSPYRARSNIQTQVQKNLLELTIDVKARRLQLRQNRKSYHQRFISTTLNSPPSSSIRHNHSLLLHPRDTPSVLHS
jgi:hypothetical protein